MRARPTAQREGGSTDCLPLPPHCRGLDSSHKGQQTALQGLPLSQAGCQAPAGFPDPGHQPPLPYPIGNDICQELRHGSVSPRSYPRYHKWVLGTTVARRVDRWHMRDPGRSWGRKGFRPQDCGWNSSLRGGRPHWCGMGRGPGRKKGKELLPRNIHPPE